MFKYGVLGCSEYNSLHGSCYLIFQDEVSDDDSVTKKRKRSQSPIEAEGNGLDSPVAKKKRLKKKRKKENTPKSEGEKEKASKSEGDSGKIKQSNKQKVDTQKSMYSSKPDPPFFFFLNRKGIPIRQMVVLK